MKVFSCKFNCSLIWISSCRWSRCGTGSNFTVLMFFTWDYFGLLFGRTYFARLNFPDLYANHGGEPFNAMRPAGARLDWSGINSCRIHSSTQHHRMLFCGWLTSDDLHDFFPSFSIWFDLAMLIRRQSTIQVKFKFEIRKNCQNKKKVLKFLLASPCGFFRREEKFPRCGS